MRRIVMLGAVAVLVTAFAAGLAIAGKDKGNDKKFEYAVGLWGDMPYSDAQAQTGVPNLIADMNDADIEFSVQDGDLKAGNATVGSATVTSCADGLYTQGLAYLNALEKPAFFTPGDNDWTDCDRTSNGGFNALERLQHERGLLFSDDKSLGKHRMKAAVQTTPQCLGTTSSTGSPTFLTACSENRRWTFRDVTYATVNVQGTCNNLCSSGSGDPKATDAVGGAAAQAARQAEYAAREAADEQWLADTFAEAKAKGSAGVMIVWQADPGFDRSGFQGAPKRDPLTLVAAPADNSGTTDFVDGWHDILVELRNEVIAYGKPVVLVHGDSHYFMIDKPLVDANGLKVENFTRVETFGDNAPTTNENHWVKALVDPKSKDVFAFQPQIVAANVVPR
jgi:hypothetical protein